MHVFIYSQRLTDSDKPYIITLLKALESNDINYCIFEPFYKKLVEENVNCHPEEIIKSYEELKRADPVDLVLTLGGDGTILGVITIIRDLEIPIAGINLGRLGFLATIEKTHITEAIASLKTGMYQVQLRSMIKLESNKDLFGGKTFALNDFTIHKRDEASMIVIHAYINGKFLNSYWADGLVISTPTGSTGYNLSGGGPIVFPSSNNFAITPIAPHNLNVRPIVISDKDVLSFKIDGRDRNYLITLDARSETVSSDIELTVSKCSWHAKIILLEGTSFIKTIHGKLYWGRDSRN